MKPAVFLGPSLPLSEAKRFLDAEFLPPCAMGDILRCVETRPPAILIIDGFFEQRPAVWHKEILHAIKAGIPVYGASSMGALRAAELDVFGMIGLGAIYEDYASGRLEDDDEVAVVHTDRDNEYRPTSEAMVNIRCGLTAAVSRGLLDPGEAAALTDFAKARFYPERSWQLVLSRASEILNADRFAALRAWLLGPDCPNQKKADAVLALQTLKSVMEVGPQVPAGDFEFEPTCYWDRVVEEFSGIGSAAGDQAHVRSFLNHVRLFEPDRGDLLRDAFIHSLLEKELSNAPFSQEELRLAMSDFRRRRGLHTPDALRQWMQQNDIDQAGTLELVKLERVVIRHLAESSRNVDKHLVGASKLRGSYAEIAERVRVKNSSSNDSELDALFVDREEGDARLLAQYQREFGHIEDDLKNHVMLLGIPNVKDFMEEVKKEYSMREVQAG